MSLISHEHLGDNIVMNDIARGIHIGPVTQRVYSTICFGNHTPEAKKKYAKNRRFKGGIFHILFFSQAV